MKKILLPTDLTELSDYAYDLAQKVCRHTQSEIELLYVVPAPAGAIFDSEGKILDDEGVDVQPLYEEEKRVRQDLDNWARNKKNIGKITVQIGEVDKSIMAYIHNYKVDLVVMGTAGADGLKEVVLGSHAGKLALHAPVPVMTLKCDRSDMVIKDILLVGDFHDHKKLNVEIIKTLQKALNAQLHFLTVNTRSDFEPTRTIQANMRDFQEVNELEDVKFHIYCDETVEKGIVNFCTDHAIDFVAIGTHQRSGLSRLFKKSISEELVNHVWQPVMTFPLS
jgi:nucleotide-binding universal stress UspA family protein